MLSRIHFLLLCVFFCFSFKPASAQILWEDQDSYIHKGFFLSAEYGPYLFALKPSSMLRDDGVFKGPQAALFGSLGGFDLGYDINKIFSLQLSTWAVITGGDPQYGGGSTALLVSLGATIYFMRTRFTLYAKAGGGLMLTLPMDLLPPGVMLHAGFGFRYYTRFKHFSLGLEARALFRPPTSPQGLSLGVAILPSLTYTF